MSERSPVSWRRWDPAPIHIPRPDGPCLAAADELNPQAAPSAQQIDEWARHAREEAYAEGLIAGRQAGHREGLEAGEHAGRATGYESGRAEGFAQGLSEARSQGLDEIRSLRDLLGACADAIDTFEARMGSALIDLAIDLARQVVRQELTGHPEVIQRVVTELLHAAPDGQPALKIWLHPDDLALVDTYLRAEHGASAWRLFPDPDMLRGGCRAESIYGAIDARLPTRWQRVTASLGRNSRWQDN